MTVRIVTDSTCDLDPDAVAAHGITVVPLTVFFGEEAFLDGIEITPETFYDRLRESPVLPRTSQPSVESFRETYEALAAETDEIVSIHLSSRLSGTLNSASVAREEISRDTHIELIDSYTVSLGLGAIVLEAAAAAADGASMARVVEVTRRAMDRVHLVAALDTLEYLQKGGRIGRARSLMGSLLSIKPIIHVDDGEVAPLERVRTRAKAVERLFEIATTDRTLRKMYVACTADDEQAYDFIERLRPLMPHTEFHLGHIGSVVGVYAGPNALGICTVERD
ncbi:MAG: DegV family protein [Chloroflexi bacterium]|nr:DegV family protein [Chloroflexota bacterium]